MPQYSEAIKNSACELYIEHGNYNLVKKQLEEEFPTEDIPTSVTISNWIKQRNLPELKQSIYVDTLKEARAKQLEKNIKRRNYVQDSMEKAFDSAADAAFGPDAKEFRSGLDAVRAMEIAAEMGRKLSVEQLNQQFLEDVFAAIRKVVHDDDVLSDIGREMLKILQRYEENGA